MRWLLLNLLCSFFILACTSGERDTNDSTQVSEVVIPEHLQDVENLTVLPADSEPLYEIELVRETNYGDKYDDVVFLGYINEFEVDSKGRVYLADMSNDKIQVYNPDGTFLKSIGRSGRGPGEFLTTRGGLDIGVNDDYLFVFDDTNYRISRFSLETFELVDIVNVDSNNWDSIEEISGSRPFEFFFRDDDRYLVHFRLADFTDSDRAQGRMPTNLRSQYYLFNHQMEPVSKKALEYERPPSFSMESGGQRWLLTFPFVNRVLTAFAESGYMYHASSREFFIRIQDSNGSYVRSVYSPQEASRLTIEDQEKIAEENEALGRGLRVADLPEQWPVLHRITVDDENRLWVSIIRDNHETTEWWLLGENFELLATFLWPRDITDRPENIGDQFIMKNGAMYHLGTDGMSLDEQTVVKYRIVLNPIQSEVAGD